MGVAEPLSLWHELRAIVPGASAKAHCGILQPLVVCVVLRAGVEPAHGVGCTISYHGHSKNHEAMAGLESVLGICAIPCALTAELPKLDMKNGPTISG